ncbi:MAG: ABC transporter substrate-binding protein [Candidatus Hydrogenedentota bacterium]|nr:MAG: ABC transporter substrate-binding protein [Candidatus Hydrogenedentota bacterium]
MRENGAKYVCAVCAILCFIAFAIGGPTPAYAAQKLTITSFGGSFQAAQRKAYMEPFAEKYGVEIIEDEWHGDMAKLRAMVQSGNVTWDVLDLSDGQIELACDEGLIEPLDPSLFGGKDAFVEGSITECGIGTIVASLVIGYDARQFPGNEPTKLTDFWDVKKFPGPRAMKKWPKHNMEFALLADGVLPEQIYELLSTEEGITRAFRKLDEIKPHVKVWFGSWAQPGQLMADGEVAMSIGTNGRLAVAAETNPNIKFFWDRQGYGIDLWGVVKGCKNKEMAIKFIQFASLPENQAEFPKYIQYGPTVKEAIEKMSSELAAKMPTAPGNMKNAWKIDSRFWSDNMDDFNIRFNAWLGK